MQKKDMYAFNILSTGGDPFNPIGTCCNAVPYLGIPYQNEKDIKIAVTSADPLFFLNLGAGIVNSGGTTFIVLTAGIDYVYSAAQDPNGVWQIYAELTAAGLAVIQGYAPNYFYLTMSYNEGASLQLVHTIPYKHYSCYGCTDWFRVCSTFAQFGCEVYGEVKEPIYYGDDVTNLQVGSTATPNNCIVLAGKVVRQGTKIETDYFNSSTPNKVTKVNRYSINELQVPDVRMSQIMEVLTGTVTIESNLATYNGLTLNVTSDAPFSDIKDPFDDCTFDLNCELESAECTANACATSLGCRYSIVGICQPETIVNITDAMTPAQLTQWNAVTKRMTWNNSTLLILDPVATGTLTITLAGSTPANRTFCQLWINDFIMNTPFNFKMRVHRASPLVTYEFLRTNLQSAVGLTTNTVLIYLGRSSTLIPVNTTTNCGDNTAANSIIAPYSQQGDITITNLVNPISLSKTERAFRVVATPPLNTAQCSNTGSFKLFNKDTGQEVTIASVGGVVSGGGLILDIPFGVLSDWTPLIIKYQNGSTWSNAVTMQQGKAF